MRFCPEPIKPLTCILRDALSAVLEGSTLLQRPSSVAKRRWSPRLTDLSIAVRTARRRFQTYLLPAARVAWLEARCVFYRAIIIAKHEAWVERGPCLSRTWIGLTFTKALNRLKQRHSGSRQRNSGVTTRSVRFAVPRRAYGFLFIPHSRTQTIFPSAPVTQ